MIKNEKQKFLKMKKIPFLNLLFFTLFFLGFSFIIKSQTGDCVRRRINRGSPFTPTSSVHRIEEGSNVTFTIPEALQITWRKQGMSGALA